MVNHDEKPTEASALDAHMATPFEHQGSEISTGNMVWTLEHLQKENDELQTLNSQLKSWSENQRSSMTYLNILSFIGAAGLILQKLNTKLH